MTSSLEQEAPSYHAASSSSSLPPPLWRALWNSPDQITAMLSNFTTDYNIVNISLVLVMLEASVADDATDGTWNDSLVSAALMAGMIVGQLGGGALGDLIGRYKALLLVIALQVVGSIGSGLLTVPNDSLFVQLGLWRLLLGVGAGGVYPLAAVLSAEQDSGQARSPPGSRHGGEDFVHDAAWRTHRLRLVALVFSMQGVGFLMASLVPWILLGLLGRDRLHVVWRCTLGLGALPGMLVLYRRFSSPARTETTRSQSSLDLWRHIRAEPHLGYKLAATALTWFLFDVLFYGNTLFTPLVTQAAFGSRKDDDEYLHLLKTARESTLLKLMALPGYYVAMALLGRATCRGLLLQTPRFMQMQGFLCMTVLYLVIGLFWNVLSSSSNTGAILLVLYGLTFFFANYGPNTTTFLLPSLLYSPSCRSTLNGVAAASGKVGALVGASLFAPLAQTWANTTTVMMICAALCVLSWFVTYAAFGAADLYEQQEEEEEEEGPTTVDQPKSSYHPPHPTTATKTASTMGYSS